MVAAVVVIAVAVAFAGGFVIGHRRGRSDDRRDLSDAAAAAQSLTQKLSAAEVALADARSTAATRKAERDAFASELGDRDRRLETVAEHVRNLEGKLKAGLAVAALGTRRADEKPGLVSRDLLKLQGVWRPTKFRVNGGDLAPYLAANEMQFECVEDRLVSRNAGDPTGVVELRPSKSPAEIDLTPSKEFNGGTMIEGIYKFEGEKVILCFARAGASRPTKFEAAEDVALLWLERPKKKDD